MHFPEQLVIGCQKGVKFVQTDLSKDEMVEVNQDACLEKQPVKCVSLYGES